MQERVETGCGRTRLLTGHAGGLLGRRDDDHASALVLEEPPRDPEHGRLAGSGRARDGHEAVGAADRPGRFRLAGVQGASVRESVGRDVGHDVVGDNLARCGQPVERIGEGYLRASSASGHAVLHVAGHVRLVDDRNGRSDGRAVGNVLDQFGQLHAVSDDASGGHGADGPRAQVEVGEAATVASGAVVRVRDSTRGQVVTVDVCDRDRSQRRR